MLVSLSLSLRIILMVSHTLSSARRIQPTQYPETDWDTANRLLHTHWQQGEHVSIIGPTGCGKTTLESRMLDARSSVVIFVTKIHDDTITKDFPGFVRIERWPPPKTWHDKVLLWPKPEATIRDTFRKQRDVFKEALDQIFRERNWCVVFDEQHYMCKQLGLESENAMYLHQGRSSGLSVVNGTQRPAWVPVVTYSSATHALLYRTTHRDDLRRLAELGGIDMRELQANLLSLSKHQFIYLNTRRGDALKSQVAL